MKILIIEDENFAADKLEDMLREIDPGCLILAKLGSIRESVKWLMQHSADLIFLDIQLSDGVSFSIFEQVHVQTPIIFTTAFDQYAIRAFRLNSIAYLLKPILHRDLAASLEKYRTLRTAFHIDFESLMAQIQGRDPGYRKRFLVQVGEKIKKIEVEEIAYFYVLDKGIFLKTFQGMSYPLEYTLDRLETIVDPDRFFRINRKFLINLDAIGKMIAYSRGRVKLTLEPPAENDEDPIVSIDRSNDFKNWLNT